MQKHAGSFCAFVIGLAALAAPAAAESAKADIRGTAEGSTVSGEAVLTDTPQGVQVEVTVAGAPPGPHGLHIHQFGACADAGNAAGGHFNPHNAPHGFLPKDGAEHAHPGDMGNIEADAQGAGRLSVLLPGVTLAGGPVSVAGRAMVLHEQADDFGQPTGNAGGRIGCGPILLVKP